MRAVDFVPAEGVEIDVEGFDIDGPVGCVGHAVDAEQGAGNGVDEVGDGAKGRNAAKNIGGVSAGYEAGVGGEEGEKGGFFQMRVGAGGGFPPFKGQMQGRGQRYPGGDIGFMVEC